MRWITSIVLGAVIFLSTSAANASPKEPARSGGSTAIQGNWFNVIPCLPHAGELGDGLPPRRAEFTCSGTSVYDGDWVGHTFYTATGTVDLEKSEAYATANQWFFGMYVEDGSYGAIRFRSVVHLDLETGAFHDSSWILDGTCGFEDSKGSIEFEGLSAAGVIGGTYVGSWKRRASSSEVLCDPGAPSV